MYWGIHILGIMPALHVGQKSSILLSSTKFVARTSGDWSIADIENCVRVFLQCLVSLMVELRLYTAVTAVRFCHEVPLTHNRQLCIMHVNRNNALVAERSNAWDCKSQKSLVQIQPSVPNYANMVFL